MSKSSICFAFVAMCWMVLAASASRAQDVSSDKKQVDFVNRALEDRLKTVREQLRSGKLDLATSNIQGATESLKELARLTQEIRKSDPGFAPNPPIDFDDTPANSRAKEYQEAKKLALDAGKKANKSCQDANTALLQAKNRQLATIGISALKFTIENAPGRPGGELTDFAVEGMKQLNSYLMGKYISDPITNNLSEVTLLKNNFVSIADGEKLLKQCEQSRDKVVALAKQMDAGLQSLKKAADAEKAWQAFRWLKEAGSGTLKVELVDFQARALQVVLNGVELTPAMKGQTFSLPVIPIVTAKVRDERRKFCLDKKNYAQKTKTIVVEPGPGGAPEDSLVFTSSALGGRTSWLIQEEAFDWSPSFNSSIENDPKALAGAYWKLERSRVRWKISAKPGEQVNFQVKGKIRWLFDQVLPAKKEKKEETNDGSATVVIKVLAP